MDSLDFIYKNKSYNAPVVYKTFVILEEIANSDDELGISELSRRLNIHKSTVFGITQALTGVGALHQNTDKKFRLGPALARLGYQVKLGLDLRTITRPFMNELCKKYQETIFLGTFDEQGITVIEKVESQVEFKITAQVGARIPSFAGATGKVFLAGLQELVIREIINKDTLPQFTENSITNEDDYLKELLMVREKGFATDFEEYIRGVNAICVPLNGPLERPVAALWMVGFSHTFNGAKIGGAAMDFMQVAVRINEILGSKSLSLKKYGGECS
ncbi:MAG: hypothetical protein APF81_25025 [Desulfosporosinus sp. BRH_c37]|nr:MAG: hypothetical protein APF81_25025 [Desulfosporosinus sp. BRH_c37]